MRPPARAAPIAASRWWSAAANARTVMLVSTPVMYGGRFLGMIGSVVDLQFLIRRLQEVNRGGLTPYVVDSEGRLVAAPLPITPPART